MKGTGRGEGGGGGGQLCLIGAKDFVTPKLDTPAPNLPFVISDIQTLNMSKCCNLYLFGSTCPLSLVCQ